MNRSGSFSLTQIIVLAILAIFLVSIIVVFFVPKSGLMDKAADLGKGLSDKYLGKASGEAKSAEVGTVRDSFQMLCGLLRTTYSSRGCYHDYGFITSVMKDGFILWQDNMLSMMDETGKQTDECELSTKPCVVFGSSSYSFSVGSESTRVAGSVSESVPYNFVNRYKNGVSGGMVSRVVNNLTFVDGHKIVIDSGRKRYDFDDKGLLFVDDSGNPCFFVTRSDSDFFGRKCDPGKDDSELDNDCIIELATGKLNLPGCS